MKIPGGIDAVAAGIVLLFGLFIIAVGFLQLFFPKKALEYLTKAGSNRKIHVTELLLRLVPAAAMVVHARNSPLTSLLLPLGYFMIATSLVLLLIPYRKHHQYALWCARWLPVPRMRLLCLPSFIFGGTLLYAAL